MLDAEGFAERVHELDVEAGVVASLGHFERRVGERRRDREGARLERAHRLVEIGLRERREVGRRQHPVLEMVDERSVLLGLGEDLHPFGIGDERRPVLLAGRETLVAEHVPELVVAAADGRRPVADVRDAVLLEQPAGVVAKARLERGHLARERSVDSKLVDHRLAGTCSRNRSAAFPPIRRSIMAASTLCASSIAIASSGPAASWFGYRDPHAALSPSRSGMIATDSSQLSNDTTSG